MVQQRNAAALSNLYVNNQNLLFSEKSLISVFLVKLLADISEKPEIWAVAH